MAIQNVAHNIRALHRLTVNDFKYRDPLWERFFLDALRNTSFEGKFKFRVVFTWAYPG